MNQPAASSGDIPLVSVIIPMYNEGTNVRRTVAAVRREMHASGSGFEVVCVDDGSTDSTRAELEKLASEVPELKVAGYPHNQGRGRALREGFKAARGKFLVSIDADLSYHPHHIPEIVSRLEAADAPDVVMASPYMPGGRTSGVNPLRLVISRCANIILRQAMGRRYFTLTGILRGYRREVFDCIELMSNDKEIHLEIVAKAEAVGLRVVEIPAVLTSRKSGSSKLRLRLTTVSHLMFSFYERPLLLFGVVGLVLTACALAMGAYLFHLYLNAALNPTRPMIWLSVLLLLAGIQMASFAFISTQITLLKKELFRTQKEILLLKAEVSREKLRNGHSGLRGQ
ncbi:MAG: glycosyltransferase [Candidatus Glassbacteria bacterium]|nr:glycosyltransferase [Candidatus Glassbacteria bacterium]